MIIVDQIYTISDLSQPKCISSLDSSKWTKDISYTTKATNDLGQLFHDGRKIWVPLILLLVGHEVYLLEVIGGLRTILLNG